MPSDLQGILLVPHSGDPHGLLKEGPCGARPPMAGKHDGYWYEYESDGALGLVVQQPDGHWDNPRTDADALVLAWGGEPVWQGAAWTEGVLAALDCDETPSWRLLVYRLARALEERRPAAVNMLRRLVGDLGTLLLLDAQGREVTDAE